MTSIVAEHVQETGASVAILCRTVGLSRATFYRGSKPMPCPDAAETDLRDAIQQIALEFSSYSYRRITAQLSRDGWRINHKRVLRLMREDNLLCLRKRGSSRPRTPRMVCPCTRTLPPN